jgi:hypothetical protein
MRRASARSHLWNVIRVRSGAPPPPNWKAAGSTRTDPAAQQGLATKGLLSILTSLPSLRRSWFTNRDWQ